MAANIDYQRLFSIAWNLLDSENEAANWHGLTMAGIDTGKLKMYYEATKLALQAAAAIRDKLQSRDLRVAAIINMYRRQEP